MKIEKVYYCSGENAEIFFFDYEAYLWVRSLLVRTNGLEGSVVELLCKCLSSALLTSLSLLSSVRNFVPYVCELIN